MPLCQSIGYVCLYISKITHCLFKLIPFERRKYVPLCQSIGYVCLYISKITHCLFKLTRSERRIYARWILFLLKLFCKNTSWPCTIAFRDKCAAVSVNRIFIYVCLSHKSHCLFKLTCSERHKYASTRIDSNLRYSSVKQVWPCY